jgi:lipoprotein-anchoring transpeptidase ErfK/SrfK
MATSPSRQLNYPIEPYPIMYAGIKDQSYRVPPVPYQRMNPDYLRQIVHNPTIEPTGTIVIDSQTNYLYLILGDRKALRYGIAFGRRYRRWSGLCEVRYREAWPAGYAGDGTVNHNRVLTGSIQRQSPGLQSPYGSRALYLYRGSTNTELVIHGTSQWDVIGGGAPEGSIVMLNQDVMDLYYRTQTGTRVTILP